MTARDRRRASTGTSPDAEHTEVQAAGRRRTLTVVRPRDTHQGAPIVLVLHGSNQTADRFRRFAGPGFDRFALRDGAVLAYLDGYKGGWNDARAGSDFPARRDGVDDVAFISAAVDLLAEHHHGDPSRVHVVGFSAGGSMVVRLLHEIPARLAGAALISATQPVPENLLAFEALAVPVPTLLFHGTRDRLVPHGGGMASLWGFRPRGLGLSASQTAAYFAARNGISDPPSTVQLVNGAVDDPTRVERTDHRQDGRAPVTAYTIHGGGHTVPGGRPAPQLMGRTSRQVVAADVIADFFSLAVPPADGPPAPTPSDLAQEGTAHAHRLDA